MKDERNADIRALAKSRAGSYVALAPTPSGRQEPRDPLVVDLQHSSKLLSKHLELCVLKLKFQKKSGDSGNQLTLMDTESRAEFLELRRGMIMIAKALVEREQALTTKNAFDQLTTASPIVCEESKGKTQPLMEEILKLTDGIDSEAHSLAEEMVDSYIEQVILKLSQTSSPAR